MWTAFERSTILSSPMSSGLSVTHILLANCGHDVLLAFRLAYFCSASVCMCSARRRTFHAEACHRRCCSTILGPVLLILTISYSCFRRRRWCHAAHCRSFVPPGVLWKKCVFWWHSGALRSRPLARSPAFLHVLLTCSWFSRLARILPRRILRPVAH